MSKTMIDKMVDRFLCWKLPEDFGPDCGISFTKFHPNGTTRFEPVGTNLFTADQARTMVKHMLTDALPADTDACSADYWKEQAGKWQAEAEKDLIVIQQLRQEVRYLRHYGNKDCTAMADAAMQNNELDAELRNNRRPAASSRGVQRAKRTGLSDGFGG